MGTTLDNGTYLPDEGERNCYEGLAGNWVALDNHLGSTNIHVTINDKQAWNSHIADTTIHVTSADKQAWNSHIADTTIHVTSADKQAWNGHVADTTIHVTAEDKAKWDAVTGKANDADVVHKSGNETISGNKTFSSNVNIYNSDSASNIANLILRNQKAEKGGSIADPQIIYFVDKLMRSLVTIRTFVGINGQTISQFRADNTDSNNNAVYSGFFINSYKDGSKSITPSSNSDIDFGTANAKWKSFNGLEPSSLSLPGYTSPRIDISSYITNLTGGSNNYTAPANGYIFVRTLNGTYLNLIEYPSGVCSSVCSQTADNIGTFLPVIKDRTCIIIIKCSSVDRAYFIPCHGNV